MADSIDKRIDPAQGLVDFTLDVKPFHSKIAEIIIEYIHTEAIEATVDDSLHICTHEGIPYHHSIFGGRIKEVNLYMNSIYIDGNKINVLKAGMSAEIIDSSGNDGKYLITYAVYDRSLKHTAIHFAEPLTSIIPDGFVVGSNIAYCYDRNGPTLSEPYLLTEERRQQYLSDPECKNGWGLLWDDYGLKEEYTIGGIDLGNNTIELVGDYREDFGKNQIVEIRFSISNDGIYHIADVGFDDILQRTLLRVHQTIPYPASTEREYGLLVTRAIGYDENVLCVSARHRGALSAYINDRITFQWLVPTQFNHPIISATAETSTVTVDNTNGQALKDLQVGQSIRIQGTTANDGTYKISKQEVSGTDLIITTTPPIVADQGAEGSILNTASSTLEPAQPTYSGRDTIEFTDLIGVTMVEVGNEEGAGYGDGGQLFGFDNRGFGMDEFNVDTDLLPLYNPDANNQ